LPRSTRSTGTSRHSPTWPTKTVMPRQPSYLHGLHLLGSTITSTFHERRFPSRSNHGTGIASRTSKPGRTWSRTTQKNGSSATCKSCSGQGTSARLITSFSLAHP
jgi:hypothetical protein